MPKSFYTNHGWIDERALLLELMLRVSHYTPKAGDIISLQESSEYIASVGKVEFQGMVIGK
jgi:hypothetical protein